MKEQLLGLIGEQTSPLFRIMTVHNAESPGKRWFENNISAFHLGNGIIASVSHNLRTEAGIIRAIPETQYQDNILDLCTKEEANLLDQHYELDHSTSFRHLKTRIREEIQPIIDLFKKINCDTRYITQYKTRTANHT